MGDIALLAAGGTGGHLFPAEALALELKARGWRIHLATDHRVEAYGQDFPAEETHLIASATLTRAPVAFVTGVAAPRPRLRAGVVADAPAEAGRRRRLRRLSDPAADARRGARCACPPSSTSRTP